ncbi:hypothetical protein ACEPPN_000690 [Leptodophora sp. 'Broadleaf-Isolate-01']
MWDLPKIREEALDDITIQSGFSTPGLWPFDEQKAVDSMHNRKTEWTGGNIKADIPVIVVGDALRIKNAKVAKKRQDKSDTRVRQMGIRDSVIKRKSDTLDIKIRKQTNLKNTSSEAIAKASLERANA